MINKTPKFVLKKRKAASGSRTAEEEFQKNIEIHRVINEEMRKQ